MKHSAPCPENSRHEPPGLRRAHRLLGSWRCGLTGTPTTPSTPTRTRCSLADWLAEHHPEAGPTDLDRRHIRGWLVALREGHSSNTARGWFAGVRHFCRWLQSEGEADQDATAGIRTPAPGDPETPVLSDADLRDRIVFVAGKASRRRGPRHRAVPLGVKAARALDRYLRERRRHPYADTSRLWLGSRGRPTLDADGSRRCSSTAVPTPASRISIPMRSATPGRMPSGDAYRRLSLGDRI